MMRIGGSKSEYFPQLGDGPPINQLVPVSKWWDQVVVLNGQRISRRDIVLAAANKDGGAHVDSKLSAEYEALAKCGAVGTFVYQTQNQKVEAPFQDARLVSLRQLGYELLHSPELLKPHERPNNRIYSDARKSSAPVMWNVRRLSWRMEIGVSI